MARDRLVNPIEIAKISTPGTNSASGFMLLYTKTDGYLYTKDGAGAEKQVPYSSDIGVVPVTHDSRSANYTITQESGFLQVICDASGGDFTLTLPNAGNSGDLVLYIVKSTSAGTVTIDGNGAQQIVGSATIQLTKQYESIILLTDTGSGWYIF